MDVTKDMLEKSQASRELTKSNMDKIFGKSDYEGLDLEKGGKGSGRKMGTAPSGKPIYDKFDHPAHEKFTAEDHEHAADLHSAHAFHYEKGDAKKFHKQQANEHQSMADSMKRQVNNEKDKGFRKNKAFKDFQHKAYGAPGKEERIAALKKSEDEGINAHRAKQNEFLRNSYK